MKTRLQLLLCLLAAVTLASRAHAQLNYNFDGTTTTYFNTFTEGIGQFTNAPALDTYLTNGTSTSSDAAALAYKNTLALNSDWTVSVSFIAPTNLSGVASLSSDETVTIGLSVEKTGNSGGSHLDFQMQIANDDGIGTNDRRFYAEYNDGFAGGADDTNTIATILTSATLNLVYDYTAGAGTGFLTAWYGSTQLGGSYDLLNGTTGWDATAGVDTVSAYIYFQSANIDSFDPDRPQFTNFTVTAVPEPATIAALMGLAALVAVAIRKRAIR